MHGVKKIKSNYSEEILRVKKLKNKSYRGMTKKMQSEISKMMEEEPPTYADILFDGSLPLNRRKMHEEFLRASNY